MEAKVAVLGQEDFVMPFKALGLDVYPVPYQRQDVLSAARRVVEGRYALIVVAEDIAGFAFEVLDSLQKAAVPCVVVVPFTTESAGFATKALAEVLKAATGISILGSTST